MTDSEREEQAQRNRERLPRFTAWLATVRAWDPKARVLWAREGEIEVGAVPPDERVRVC
jgi:hypothetical protein